MLKSNGSPPTRIDKRVLQFITLCDEIKEIEEKHKKELAPYYVAKDKLDGELQSLLESAGRKSAKTVYGIVTIKVTPYASCSDPDIFVNFVRENDAWELMDRRANATACKDYAEQHGTLPPGVKLTMKRTAGVTRA